MSVDPIEFGRVLGRLDSQDRELAALKELIKTQTMQIEHLVALANRGRGGLLTLMGIGTVISTVIGWTIGHWVK